MTPVTADHVPLREFLGGLCDLLVNPDVIEIHANPDGVISTAV